MSSVKVQQAEALLQRGELEQARALLTAALRAKPGDLYGQQLMALVLGMLGQTEAARHYAERALAAAPNDALVLARCATSAAASKDLDRAIALAQRSIALDPRRGDAHQLLVTAFTARKQHRAAAEAARAGLNALPAHEDLAKTAYLAWRELGRPGVAVELAQTGLRHHPESIELNSMVCSGLNYLPATTAAQRLAAARSFGAAIVANRGPAPFITPPATGPERRLRVGLLSADLRQHSVAYFAEPLLRYLPRDQFEVVAFHTANREDAVSARLRPLADAWHHLGGLDDASLAVQLHRAELDVLVELHGHTNDHRLAALKHRVATLQATYCGYPGTTGLPGMDVRFVDALTDPLDQDAFHTERLERLDGCFLAYTPPTPHPPHTAPAEALEATPIGDRPPTFGSFNATVKISDQLVALWARVLTAVPGSRLLLKSPTLGRPDVHADLAARLTAAGLPPDRVEFRGFEADVATHLSLYDRVDVALDTYPYHGTTTTCEALWMGVPVVTLIGDAHVSRVGLSLLTAAGLADWCARDETEYVGLATRLMAQREQQRAVRATLRARVAASPLCDGPAFGARFAAALRRAWHRACEVGSATP